MNERPAYGINAGGRLMDLSKPLVMGILNATPDSFYAASRTQTEHDICARADEIVAEGAAIIDVGAFSTRPGAIDVTVEEEMARLRTALSLVRRGHPDMVVSVDTFRPDVARMAVEEYGVAIVNDVSDVATRTSGGCDARRTSPTSSSGQRPLAPSNLRGGVCAPGTSGGCDVPEMFAMVARLHVPYVLMSRLPSIDAMLQAFAEEVNMLRGLGVADIILDPGFGFGKDLSDNYAVMAGLERLSALGLPLLVGVSRKSMITRLLGCETSEALNATTALHAVALMKGASILRVHDVKEAVEACRIVGELRFEV